MKIRLRNFEGVTGCDVAFCHCSRPLFLHTQVAVGDSVCTGVGPNKKLAKRVAAEQMLLKLGYSLTPPPPLPAKPALKTSTDGTNGSASVSAVSASAAGSDKHVTFAVRDTSASRQSVVVICSSKPWRYCKLCLSLL